jgi:hypothetical protein
LPRSTPAGLKAVTGETITESTQFETGNELWDRIVWSNPIVEDVLSHLQITKGERDVIRQTLD